MSDSSVTPWTVAHQTPLSMGFSRQEYWSELTFPSLWDLPDPGRKPASPALAGGFFFLIGSAFFFSIYFYSLEANYNIVVVFAIH